jgi:hypothetical protein
METDEQFLDRLATPRSARSCCAHDDSFDPHPKLGAYTTLLAALNRAKQEELSRVENITQQHPLQEESKKVMDNGALFRRTSEWRTHLNADVARQREEKRIQEEREVLELGSVHRRTKFEVQPFDGRQQSWMQQRSAKLQKEREWKEWYRTIDEKLDLDPSEQWMRVAIPGPDVFERRTVHWNDSLGAEYSVLQFPQV